MSLRRITLAAALAALLPAAAWAQADSCSIMNAPALSFMPYTLSETAPNEATTIINIVCSGIDGNTASYTIAASTGSSNSYVARGFAGQPLEYNLYIDPARSLVWGDGSEGTMPITGADPISGGTSNGNHTVYGRIPAMQDADPGEVADVIKLMLDF